MKNYIKIWQETKKNLKINRQARKDLFLCLKIVMIGSLQSAVECEKNKDYRSAYMQYKDAAEQLVVIIGLKKFAALEEVQDIKLFIQRIFRCMALIKHLANESIKNIVKAKQEFERQGKSAVCKKELPQILTLTDQILFNIPNIHDESVKEDTIENLIDFVSMTGNGSQSKATFTWIKDSCKIRTFLELKHDWDSVKYLLNKKQTCTFFEDIQGYDLLKRRLYMGVIYPMLRPEKKKTINCQNLSRNNCLLLHGPSGTGKTQLANAIATELREKAIFLHIKSSDILGKYLGESEKNIKNIFLMAEEMTQFAKVILFFDEGENIFASREGGNKYTTAVTSELLSFMSEQPELMVIVSTNLPWRLEEAFRRRFTDKIMVDLPSKHDLAVMLKFQLREFFIIMTDEEYADVASQMTDFTGGDVALLCDQIKASMNQDINGADFFRPCPYRKDGTLVPCDKDDFGAQEINLSDLHHHIIDHQGYKKKDVLQVLSSVQRSTSDSQVMHHRIYAKDNSYHPSNEGSSEDSARWRKMQETILNKNKEVIDNGLSEIAKKFDKK